jgi:hypothetical protein
MSDYAAGVKTMDLHDLEASGTIEEDQEFTIAGQTQVYSVTEDATISGNTATIFFEPGLEAGTDNETVVTLVQTTLTRDMEMALKWYVEGMAMLSSGNLNKEYASTGHLRYQMAINQMREVGKTYKSLPYEEYSRA